MGISAVAPSAQKLVEWTEREKRVIDNGGAALPPHPAGAVPGGPAAFTIPPRENGGNFDVKQLTAGSKLFVPIFKTGGLFSTGDAHFAQGDGEVCLTGVEIGATAVVRFQLHKGAAASRKVPGSRVYSAALFSPIQVCCPRAVLGSHGNADHNDRRD